MIERLMDLERPYGEPKYSVLSEETSRLKALLYNQLDQEGMGWLEQLTDTYMRQEDAILRDAFADGFWAAVDLALEFQRGKTAGK